MSHKVLLTVHPAIYQQLLARQKLGYGSVQEVINEILRNEFKPRKNGKKKRSYEDYLR